MKLSTRILTMAGTSVFVAAGVMPAAAWEATHAGAVRFVTVQDQKVGRLWDTKDEGRAVRAVYTRRSGNEFQIFNGGGPGTYATTPKTGSDIVAVIVCVDYPFGDDCSPKRFA